MIVKGYTKTPKSVHHLIKKGYTKAHIKNSKDKKHKDEESPLQLHTGAQLEEGNNNFEEDE